MRLLTVLSMTGLIAGCSAVYEPDVDMTSVDPARYQADLRGCRGRSGDVAANGDAGTAETVSAPVGNGTLSAGGAGNNLAPTGRQQRRDVDTCLRQRGYTVR